MTDTYRVKIELDRYLQADKSFYVVFEFGRIADGMPELKRLIARGFNEILHYIDNKENAKP